MEQSKKNKGLDVSILLDNGPKANDDYQKDAEILNSQINRVEVKNIAIVASLGAGKSCVIETYLRDYQQTEKGEKQYTKVSLASFNDTKYDPADIERGILQQLLYSRPKKLFPNSKIERTANTKSHWWIPLIIIVFISSTILFGMQISSPIFAKPDLIELYFLGGSMVSLFCLLALTLYFNKFKKIKYKDFELEVKDDNNGNKSDSGHSLINRFIDEVLYFFECTKINLVIFEDLDRLETRKSDGEIDDHGSAIFVKLRELNTIINNSQEQHGKKKITFLYATRDDIIKEQEQRGKFFEFILPIVPVLNPVTVILRIQEIQKRLYQPAAAGEDSNIVTNKLHLESEFIHSISTRIPDMRTLNNTFNDFIISRHRIFDEKNDKELTNENLFALCLYKNLFPFDYSLLEKNRGLIPIIFKKVRLLKEECRQPQDEELVFDELFSSENLTSFKNDYNDLSAFIGRPESGTTFESKLDYVKFLIHNTYIAINYMNYVSSFKSTFIPADDITFIEKVQQGSQDFDMPLTEINSIVTILRKLYFSQNIILNKSLIENMNEFKGSHSLRYNALQELINGDDDEVRDKIIQLLVSWKNEKIKSFLDHIKKDNQTFYETMISVEQITKEKKDLMLTHFFEKIPKIDELNCSRISEYISQSENYFDIIKGAESSIEEMLLDLQPKVRKLRNVSGEVTDDVTKMIIAGNHYLINLDNLVMIMGVSEENTDLQMINYSYIKNENEAVAEYIKNNLKDYVSNVMLNEKNVNTEDDYAFIISILCSDIDPDLKLGIVKKYSFIVEDIVEFDLEMSKKLLLYDRVSPVWRNILHAYTLKVDVDTIINYLLRHDSLTGSLDDSLKEALFYEIANTSYDEDKSIQLERVLDSINYVAPNCSKFRKDETLSIFISKGRVGFNVNDLSELANKQLSLSKYFEVYNDEITKNFENFFSETNNEINGSARVYYEYFTKNMIAPPIEIMNQFAVATDLEIAKKMELLNYYDEKKFDLLLVEYIENVFPCLSCIDGKTTIKYMPPKKIKAIFKEYAKHKKYKFKILSEEMVFERLNKFIH